MRAAPCPAADASHAVGANLPRAQHQQEAPPAQDLALSAEECGDRSAQSVWCADITYIPMRRGFLYLVAIMDWYSRKVLAWRLPNSMDAEFCVEALKEAIASHSTPEIFNTDQGSQFTSGDWIDVLSEAKIKISMDGKGRWIDNRMIERLWRSLKYECVYLHAFEKGSEAKAGIRKWLEYYNAERPHSNHGILTPDEAYASKIETMRLAA
jgi:putative transposase